MTMGDFGFSGWWFLSYASVDDEFNGAVIVKADNEINAVQEARRLNISPGGEVLIFPIPHQELPIEEYRNTLLSEESLSLVWPDVKNMTEHEKESNMARN